MVGSPGVMSAVRKALQKLVDVCVKVVETALEKIILQLSSPIMEKS